MKYIYYILLIIYHSSAAAVTASCGGYTLDTRGFPNIRLEDAPSVTLAQLRASPYTLKAYINSQLLPIECQFWVNDAVTINNKAVNLIATPAGYQTVGTTYFLNLNEGGLFGTLRFEDCSVDSPQYSMKVEVVNKNNLIVRSASSQGSANSQISATWELPSTVDLGAAFAGDSLSRNLAGPVGGYGRLDITRPSEKGAHIRLGLNGFPVETSSVSVPEGVSWSAHMDTSRETPPGEYKATVTATLLCS